MIRRTNDYIKITNMRVYAYHGVLEEEKINGQEFFLNAKVYVDMRKAGLTDDLEDAINYDVLCIFLQEVFKKGSLESLDRETLMTVQSFFENNLNVSETSRKLFVHRNTLVYRLEKIRKLTGLDLREFDHAVTFKVALMVKKYLTSKPTKF